MFVCLDCNDIFDEPKVYTETHGLDSPPYETYSGCPRCGGAFVEACKCELCGGWITGEYIELENGAMICDDCYVIRNIEDMR